MAKIPFHINESNDLIDGYILYYKQNIRKPLIIILHGFKASKDWGFFPLLAKSIAKQVGISLIFDFSRNGKPDKNYYFRQANKFANNTITRQIEDLKVVIDKFKKCELISNERLSKLWDGRIFLLGHSLGAGIALLYTQFYNNIERISAWAPIGLLNRYSERQKQIWKDKGYLEFQINQTRQLLRINVDYLIDIENNIEKYSISDAVKNLNILLQIIYGKEDLTITKAEIDLIKKNINQQMASIHLIKNTGHTFGYNSTNENLPIGFNEALDLTIEFFNK